MKKGEISVSEFKSWMSGVEDMQEKGWVPNQAQWNKIKAKIALLSEEVVEVTEQNNYHQPVQQNVYHQPVSYEVPNYQPYIPQISSLDVIAATASAPVAAYMNGDQAEFF